MQPPVPKNNLFIRHVTLTFDSQKRVFNDDKDGMIKVKRRELVKVRDI